MASNENQGLQIALIIFFGLVLILVFSTWFAFKNYQEADGMLRQQIAAHDEMKTERDAALAETVALKKMIGMKNPEAPLAETKTTYEGDMKKFGGAPTNPADPDDKGNYRKTLEDATNAATAANAELVKATDENTALKAINTAFEASSKQKVTAAEATRDAALAELKAEKQKFMDAEKKLDGEKADLAAQLAKAQADKTTEVETVKKETETAQKTIGQLNTTIGRLSDENQKIKGEGVTYNQDDGEIREVNQRTGTVWINVGSADALRRQVTFEVRRAGMPATEPGKKADIEVTQILGDHLAEAKILNDNLADPIVPGDKIRTYLWDPGHPEHFAIAGRIDFTGDGRDDRARLRNLITINGGVIDAEADSEDNKVTGQITPETRYLILGPMGAEKSREGWAGFQAKAKQLGVEPIGVDKFLDHIGYRDPNEVVRFGHNSNVETMRPQVPDGGVPVSKGGTSDIFKKRRPGQQPLSAY
jgi:hypothetical protein